MRVKDNTLQTGNHIQRDVKIISIHNQIPSMDNVGLRQIGAIFFDTLFQRDGRETS